MKEADDWWWAFLTIGDSSVLCDLLESHKESIIPLSEKSRILRAVFDVMTLPEGRLETCQFKTLAASDMERILLTLDKYGVDKGGLALLRAWKKVVPEHPFDAFVVACKCGKEDFAQVALSHFTPCIEFEEDTQYEGMNSKTVKMRPWDEGGQWLKSQISAAAFASYTAACFAGCFIAYESSAIDEEGRCWAHEDAEIDWKKAGEAFRL